MRALRSQPTSARRRPATDFEDAAACQLTEQTGVRLTKTLRAPHEIRQAQKIAVRGELVLSVGVPPAAIDGHCLRDADQPFRHTDCAQHRLGAAVKARWNGPIVVVPRLRRASHWGSLSPSTRKRRGPVCCVESCLGTIE